jgi:tetratricopeptide (TPR) repeat protein
MNNADNIRHFIDESNIKIKKEIVNISLNNEAKPYPTLCLNMIVKNESKVIHRLLESVSKVVDSYCICDTGSTDNTIEIITEFFQKKGIPGKIVQEPFRDFGYNRTFALDAAKDQSNADYLLLLDADMIFWLNPDVSPIDFKKGLLEGDAFYLYQGSDSFYYKNTRIVRNNAGVKYWGVTHEYTVLPDGFKANQIQKNRAFIRDIGDGGAKSDKYERDIRLLQKGLLENPTQVRYMFYLANSYMNGGYPDDAIKMYRKRIDAGGWIEEIWYSCYNIGKIYRDEKKDMASAIWWWMEAYRRYPNRIEQLYEIVKYYRETGANEFGHMFYELADRARIKYPEWDYLFMEKDMYDYKLDYEFSIIGYYCNPNNADLAKISMKVLADPKVEGGISKNTMSNYKFYARKLADWDVCKDTEYMNSTHSGRNLLKTVQSMRSIGESIAATWEDRDSFFKSTPSVVALSSSMFVVSQRYVNYYINDKGGYEQNGDIITRNVIGIVDDGVLVREFELKYDTTVDGVYRGLEDVRLWTQSNGDVSEVPSIYYSSNRGLGHSNMVVEVGKIDLLNKTTVESRHLKMNENQGRKRDIEKNWVIIDVEQSSSVADKYNMVYDWNPVVTGSVAENTFNVMHKQESLPNFFRYLRGSTNSVEVGGELWFIAHAVSYEDRRYYYHIVVAMDKTTREIKKYTPFFTFQGEKVEYTLGMVLIDSRLLIGYSVMDKRTEWIVVPQHVISDMFISI